MRVCGATHVRDLGSGLAFRGAALTEAGGVQDVETDVPEVVALQRVLHARVPALRAAWKRAGVESRTLDEKAAIARRLQVLFAGGGGVWISPDFHTREALERQYRLDTTLHATHAAIAATTARNFDKTAFEDDAHVVRLFADLGFAAEKTSQLDGTFALVSPARLGLPDDCVARTPPMLLWLRTDGC